MTATTPFLQKAEKLGPLASRYVEVETLPWKPTPCPGIDMKVLLEDPETGLLTALFRWQPGSELALHEHVEIEQTFVLEGSLVDDRNMPIGIECQVRGGARLAGREIDLQVLVIEAQLLGHPQGAKGARPRDAVDLERHRISPYLRSRPTASPARKMFGFKNIDSTSAPPGERAMCRLPFGRHT